MGCIVILAIYWVLGNTIILRGFHIANIRIVYIIRNTAPLQAHRRFDWGDTISGHRLATPLVRPFALEMFRKLGGRELYDRCFGLPWVTDLVRR
ncbi:Uncharacterized protein HZ326_30543 [Fusarium oxysporum f. sp. albedinis]|nr:Uncharacterized protein HZ326_30543 [Fusarium oxysporum f. sp. albedinis]